MPKALTNDERLARAHTALLNASRVGQEPDGRARTLWVAKVRSRLRRAKHYAQAVRRRGSGATLQQDADAAIILAIVERRWPTARRTR